MFDYSTYELYDSIRVIPGRLVSIRGCGSYVLTGGWSCKGVLYKYEFIDDRPVFQEVKNWNFLSNVHSVDITKDHVAFGLYNGFIHVTSIGGDWSSNSAQIHLDWVQCVRMIDSKIVSCSSGNNRNLVISDLHTLQVLHILSGHNGRVRTIHADRFKIISGSSNGYGSSLASVIVWDWNGNCLWKWAEPTNTTIRGLAVYRHLLIVSDRVGHVHVMNFENSKKENDDDETTTKEIDDTSSDGDRHVPRNNIHLMI